ncbi:MAG TPA: J domain-containing protein [Candidatus Mediterraneibacter merdigallinarum]|nr:J domain-containing protein [Candidatus Mediterraneibacter merdigallinarum]
MPDPYSVLGVDRNASDDELKKAYRSLSRKYHPDANINNPHKDEAEAKFKEVQQAYQQIMDERERGYTSGGGGSSSGSGSGYGGSFYGGYGPFGGFGSFDGYGGYGQSGESDSRRETTDPHLKAAANYIRSGHYREALNVLDGIKERNALWYFYSASANSGLGNNVTALEHAREAVRLEPENMQYRMLLERMEGGGTWYQQRQTMYGYPGSFDSSCCVKLCVANLLCNLCCGGGGLCCGGYGGSGYGGYA